MQRSDYLDPAAVKEQCAGAVQQMERDNKALQIVWDSLVDFSEEDEIKSDSFQALKRQLKDYGIIIEALRIANDSDMRDYESLSASVGEEVLDGEMILGQMEHTLSMMEEYQANEEMLRDRMRLSGDPATCFYYSRSAEKYGQLAALSQRLYEKWMEKAERFDEIAERTGSLFEGGKGLDQKIRKGLSQITGAFQKGEYVSGRNREWKREIKNAALRFSMCFGDYGGKQEGPAILFRIGDEADREAVRKLVHSYKEYEDYSDREIAELLEKLNSEGCGYVAFANIIVDEYRGKEEKFKEVFGFPLFSKHASGEEYVNYNQLILDLYCASDNHVEKGILWWRHDEYDADEDYSSKEGSGTTQGDRIYRFKRYMKAHGVKVEIKNLRCNARNVYKRCREEMERGNRVIISTHPVRLEAPGGKQAQMDGGHAMTVTGLTDDGKVEVSSWGKRYQITPDRPVYKGRCSEETCGEEAYVQIQSVSFL